MNDGIHLFFQICIQLLYEPVCIRQVFSFDAAVEFNLRLCAGGSYAYPGIVIQFIIEDI